MPSRCVAAGCSNTSSESVSVYKFPKQETLLKQWTKQVQRTRANWVPTASSTLCSEHFEADCFEETPQYKKVLKPNANPTIFKRSLVGTSETETPSTSTGSSQYKKRKSVTEKLAQKRVSLTFITKLPPLGKGRPHCGVCVCRSVPDVHGDAEPGRAVLLPQREERRRRQPLSAHPLQVAAGGVEGHDATAQTGTSVLELPIKQRSRQPPHYLPKKTREGSNVHQSYTSTMMDRRRKESRKSHSGTLNVKNQEVLW
uniref:THAP-type domain-containing protein n=1 Tax=Oryzias latipes TaxID=8090 RepID=A0A3P9HHD6_ORYLA